MILHEAQFLSTCEPMEPDKLYFQNTVVEQAESRHFHFKRTSEKMVTGSKQVQKLARKILSNFKARE